MAPSSKLLWVFLSAHAGTRGLTEMSIETMAGALEMTPKTITHAVRELVDASLIERVRLGRYHTPTLYRVAVQPRYLDKVA